jgi:protein TonB
MPAKTAPAPDRSSFQSSSRSAPAFTPPSAIEPLKIEAPLPIMGAVGKIQKEIEAKSAAVVAPIDQAPATPVTVAQTPVASIPEIAQEVRQAATPSVAKIVAVEADSFTPETSIAPVVVPNPRVTPAVTSIAGSAAAVAPARAGTGLEAPAPLLKESQTAELEPANAPYEAAPGATPLFGSMGASDAPTFGGLSEEDSGRSGGRKKLVIAAAAVLALAALGYVTFGEFGHSSGNAAPQSVNPPSERQPPPVLAPMSSPAPAPSTSNVDQASVATQPAAPKGSPSPLLNKLLNRSTADAANSPAIRIAANAEPAVKNPNATPIVVKASPADANPRSQVQAAESAPTLAVAPANDSSLNGLMASAAPNLSKPTLATLRISQGVSQGLLIKRVQPQYPQAALAVRAQGAVQIEATVNKEGIVVSPKVLSGDPILARAAVEAVRQWRYKPYYLDGQPVEIQTQITVNFKTN